MFTYCAGLDSSGTLEIPPVSYSDKTRNPEIEVQNERDDKRDKKTHCPRVPPER